MAREFDLMSTWNKLSLDPTILSEPSIYTSVVYAGQWLPFPMHHSDLVIHAHWADLAEVRSTGRGFKFADFKNTRPECSIKI